MAVFAIGDIQGCYRTFRKLLSRIGFDPASDRLWVVGDMVNRGAGSLDVMRWLQEHDEAVTAVLGNHDLHLLAVACGLRKAKKKDTITPILDAPDAAELLGWARARPLLHRDGELVMVHAGILPAWTVDDAAARAAALERALRGDAWADAVAAIYDKQQPSDLRDTADVLTRLRMCTAAGEPDYDFVEDPRNAPPGLIPWFDVPNRRSADHTIVFGHWAALGLRIQPGIVATDSGCVWGEPLSAVRLPDCAVWQEPNAELETR